MFIQININPVINLIAEILRMLRRKNSLMLFDLNRQNFFTKMPKDTTYAYRMRTIVLIENNHHFDFHI